MSKVVSSSNAPAAVGPYSQAIVSNGFIFCAGQIGIDPKNGELVGDTVESQTEQVLKNLSEVLKAAGSSLEKATSSTCYLTTMEHYAKFNKIYGKYFSANKPARVTVAVAALPKNALVEVSIIAEV